MKLALTLIFVFFLALVANSQSAIVITEKAKLRGTPSEKGKVIIVLSEDTEVVVIKQTGPWFLVQAATDVGWIHGRTIRLTADTKDDSITPKPMRLNVDTMRGTADSNTRVGAEDDSPPKPTPKPAPRMISGGVLNGKAISLPSPEYPPTALAVRASGPVSIMVVIDENGDVILANAASGHPLLRDASESAARAAKFNPMRLEGQPVKVSGVITYNFNLK